MDYFDENVTPREKFLQILQISGPSAVGLAIDELILRLLACESLLEESGLKGEDVEARMKEPQLLEGMDDLYIDLQAKIVSCEGLV